MNGPPRLLEQPGPSARLLRGAEFHVPSERARRRALASVASAAATLAVSGGSAALGGGALLKSALTWLCVGILGGTVVTVAVTSMTSPPSPIERKSAAVVELSALGPAKSGEAKAATRPEVERVETAPSERHTAAGLAGSQAAREPVPRDVPTASAASVVPSASAVLTFASGTKPSPSLFEELRLIDSARKGAERRDTGAVLVSLDQYDSSYPRGHFLPESLALRIETLGRAGDRVHAQALAARFRRDYPQHPLLTRVNAAVGD